ncbi:MAG: alpha/beta hydrolase [Acidobacteriaceae bacterium]|nr:alpha/beta hydrolase [Acidobacteriaceae bacterium]
MHLTDVSVPNLTVYLAPTAKATGAAVVVFPGGGYRILAYDLEGTEICDWLNGIGITAVLVKYRVPQPQDAATRFKEPLQDAQRAVGIVRHHAKEWGIDGARIGVLGFSAGGHLCAVLSNHSEERTYERVDESDAENCRPDFVVLVYPAYLSEENKGTQVAPEARPSANRTPPTFIVQAQDDKSYIDGTLLYYRAVTDAQIPAELHVYPAGGHGYGLRATGDPVSGWPRLVEAWLQDRKLLNGKG